MGRDITLRPYATERKESTTAQSVDDIYAAKLYSIIVLYLRLLKRGLE